MVLELRPEISRDPLLIGELNAKNMFVVEKFDVPAPTSSAPKDVPVNQPRQQPPRAANNKPPQAMKP